MDKQERTTQIKDFLSHFGDLKNIELNQNYSHAYSLQELESKTENLFFCWWVNEPKKWGVNRTTKPWDIIYKNYFAIDIDLRKQYAQANWCEPNDVTDEQLFQQIDSVKDMLSQDPLLKQRSYIVFTWNWCHVYYCGYRWDIKNWELTADEYHDGVMEVYRSWNIFTTNIRWEFNYYYSDGSTANIDRILRLPYSYNAKPTNKDGRKIPVKILYQQDEVSDMVEHLKEYAEKYREFQKSINKVVYKDEKPSDVTWFMWAFVKYCDTQVPIRDVLDKLWIRYSWHAIYEWDRKTNWWKIWNNCVVNHSKDSSDSERAQWWCYSFVKHYLRHTERKETINRFKENFESVREWAEKNKDNFQKEEKKEIVVPEIKYDSTSVAYKLADPVFDVLWCMYKWDMVTIVAEWNSWKTTFALDICRRNEAEGHKCFYLNLEFWLETTFQRRWQELHNLTKIDLTKISELDRQNLNNYVAKCLEWIHHDSRKSITIEELKELLIDLWKQWYELVIIDTFSKIEWNMGNWARWCQNQCMSELEDLANKTWLVIVSLHHTNRVKKFSWSQKIFDLSKVFYTITVLDETTRTYACEKDKFWCTGKEVDVSYKAWEYRLSAPAF